MKDQLFFYILRPNGASMLHLLANYDKTVVVHRSYSLPQPSGYAAWGRCKNIRSTFSFWILKCCKLKAVKMNSIIWQHVKWCANGKPIKPISLPCPTSPNIQAYSISYNILMSQTMMMISQFVVNNEEILKNFGETYFTNIVCNRTTIDISIGFKSNYFWNYGPFVQ